MATRFYFRENEAAPISPAVDGTWGSSASPFDRGPMYLTTDSGDTLTTITGFTSSAGQIRCHRQWISEPMGAGNVFNTGVTYKCYAQAYETSGTDNCIVRAGIRILSEDGSTVRHTVRAVFSTSVTEWASGSIRNAGFLEADAGVGSYTTVAGDRLVVELGHTDQIGSTPEGNTRWGSAGSSDLPENLTDTSTTARPWFETSLNLTFPQVFEQAVNATVAASATAAKGHQTVSATVPVTATMVRGASLSKIVSATVTATASVARVFVVTQVLSATVSAAASITKTTLKLLSAQAVTSVRGVLDTILVFIPGITPVSPTSLGTTSISHTDLALDPVDEQDLDLTP